VRPQIVFGDLRPENVCLDQKMGIRIGRFVTGDEIPAPEVVMEQEATPAVAIWNLGILLIEMVSSHRLFDARHHGKRGHTILRDDPLIPVTITPHLNDLLRRMLAKDPLERITLENIKAKTGNFFYPFESKFTQRCPVLSPANQRIRAFFDCKDIPSLLRTVSSRPTKPPLALAQTVAWHRSSH
jgi:serine/threonine protein kinase